MAPKTKKEKIQALAYKYYLQRGKIDGFDQVDWRKATESVEGAERFKLIFSTLLLVVAVGLFWLKR